MIFKSADQKRERRDRFQAGNGGGYCTHALEPSRQIRGSRFHQASRVELDPGAVISEHLHSDNEEMYWILSGSGLFIDDGIEVAALPGDLLLTGQGHRHGLRNTGAEPLVFLAIVAGAPHFPPGPTHPKPPNRRSTMKRFITFLPALVTAGLLFAGSAAAETVIKIGNVLNPDHVWNTCLNGFADDVKTATNGRVVIKVYPSSQLGNEKDLIEGMTLQTVDGGLIGGGSFQSIEPKFGIEALPYAFPTHEAAYKALDGELGDRLLKILAAKGVVGLAWWENGFRHITNSKRPIVAPADLAGLKIRVTPDKMRLDTFKTLGASPMPINFGELYSALQQGVVDGQENPFAIIFSSAFYEVQQYLSLSGHVWGSALLCVNGSLWKRISPEDQATVMKLAAKWRDEERRLTIAQENDFLEKLKAKGMKINEVDKTAFQTAVKGVWAEYEGVFGKDMLELVEKAGK